MSYHALYRKYRPSSLDSVVGQQYIVKIIKNSLSKNRISHAYMFSGPRGTGKTTMAKILAQNVNCLEPNDGMACGKCKNCLTILNHTPSDIIEIDAASNNGVDEIREIRNKINLVPSELKYKVYIIDEVHMLSIGAFNALLKTLEEPPEHIIFVLATTDLHKVPVTIISRCQCFEFKRLTEQEIINRLSYIASEEKIDLEDGIIEAIASLADGGLRDAIGMLDKIASYTNDKITLNDFEELNGIVSNKEKKQFVKMIENKEVFSIISFIDKIYNSGKDLSIFCQDLLILCRNLIVDYYMDKTIDYDINFLLKFVEYFSELSSSIKISNNMRILFEIKVLSFMNLYNKNQFIDKIDRNVNISTESVEKSDSITEKITNEVEKIEKHSQFEEKVNSIVSVSDESDNYLEINSLIINNCFARASKDSLNNIKEKWKLLNDYALDSQFGAVACYLVDGVVRAASSNEVIITFDYDSMVNRGYKLINKIENLFDKILNCHYHVAIITTDQWNNEKSQYIENKNRGIIYEYKEIPVKEVNIITDVKISNDESGSITDKAIQMFGENVVINI